VERDELIVGLSSCLEALFFPETEGSLILSVPIARTKIPPICSPFLPAIEARHQESLTEDSTTVASASASSVQSSTFSNSVKSASSSKATDGSASGSSSSSESGVSDISNQQESTDVIDVIVSRKNPKERQEKSTKSAGKSKHVEPMTDSISNSPKSTESAPKSQPTQAAAAGNDTIDSTSETGSEGPITDGYVQAEDDSSEWSEQPPEDKQIPVAQEDSNVTYSDQVSDKS
jgi:trimeric autotransporter adhesin